MQASDLMRIELTVNGRREAGHAEPRMLLSDFIRHTLGLTGTHVGCEHGVCGACTVMVDGAPMRSCLIFAVQAAGAEIITVEGLATDAALSPLQEAFREHHGLQCGFCTPGFLISALDLIGRKPDLDEQAVREGLSGHLCRCTGYEGIVAAVLAAAKRMQAQNADQQAAQETA